MQPHQHGQDCLGESSLARCGASGSYGRPDRQKPCGPPAVTPGVSLSRSNPRFCDHRGAMHGRPPLRRMPAHPDGGMASSRPRRSNDLRSTAQDAPKALGRDGQPRGPPGRARSRYASRLAIRSSDLAAACQEAPRRAQEGTRAGGRPGGPIRTPRRAPGACQDARRLTWAGRRPKGRYDAQEGARAPLAQCDPTGLISLGG